MRLALVLAAAFAAAQVAAGPGGDPATGNGHDLEARDVRPTSVLLSWNWTKGCSSEVLAVVYEDPRGDYANATRHEAHVVAVEGPMASRVRGLAPDLPHEAFVAAGGQPCGLGGGTSNVVTFTTPGWRFAGGLEAVPVVMALAGLGLALRR